jgi:hypothetical protein
VHQPLPGKVYAQQNTLSLPGNAIWASGKFSSKLQNQVFGQLKSKLQLNPVNFGHNNFFLNWPICHYMFYRPPTGLKNTVLAISFRNSFWKFTSIAWFQYRGNKQFGPFFGPKFDPKCQKELWTIFCFKSKLSPNLSIWWWLYERWPNNWKMKITFWL